MKKDPKMKAKLTLLGLGSLLAACNAPDAPDAPDGVGLRAV